MSRGPTHDEFASFWYTEAMILLLLALLFFALLAAYLWWNRSALFVAGAHRAFQRGDEKGTLASFAKAEAAGRLDVQNTVSYAYLALKNGQTGAAGELLDRCLSQGRRGRSLKESDRRLVESYRALVLWKQGHLDQAVVVLEELLSLGYQTTTLYGNLGFFLVLQKNWERAETVCLQAVAWDPEGKVILDNLASLYMEKEQWEKAAEIYQRLLALRPQFPEAWSGAGWAALKTGDAVEAKRCWEQALRLPFHSLTTVERANIEAALAMV